MFHRTFVRNEIFMKTLPYQRCSLFLAIPATQRFSIGDCVFVVAAASAWNIKLPQDIRHIATCFSTPAENSYYSVMLTMKSALKFLLKHRYNVI